MNQHKVNFNFIRPKQKAQFQLYIYFIKGTNDFRKVNQRAYHEI
jgi:hypothetical protein